MTDSTVQQKLELARFEAVEKQKEYERRIELIRMEVDAHVARDKEMEAAHRREMEARDKEREARDKELEEKEKERKHALEMEKAKAQQNIPTNPSNPSPGTTSHPRKFPTNKAGDDTETFLENFESACLGYSISTDQYM
ncbi:101 kDa malaria antigen-like [Dermochelys coriacea]|uniref:101 kDa malaria antigen-like n=1 Tax=Dermochelys coriacea TaxID=27794 RepID=UPI001CAA3F5D|nr:101 kDa malaria antigen-like [Dermochelys coriacea]